MRAATYSVNTRGSYLWNLALTLVRLPNNWIQGLDYWIEPLPMLCHKKIVRFPLDRVNSSPNCSPNVSSPNQDQIVTYLNGINLRAKKNQSIWMRKSESVFIVFLLKICMTWGHECHLEFNRNIKKMIFECLTTSTIQILLAHMKYNVAEQFAIV